MRIVNNKKILQNVSNLIYAVVVAFAVGCSEGPDSTLQSGEGDPNSVQDFTVQRYDNTRADLQVSLVSPSRFDLSGDPSAMHVYLKIFQQDVHCTSLGEHKFRCPAVPRGVPFHVFVDGKEVRQYPEGVDRNSYEILI